MKFRFLFFLVLIGLTSCNNSAPQDQKTDEAYQVIDGTAAFFNKSQRPFYHGVASGDPLPDRVILWTRVTPDRSKEITVKWEVAIEPTFKSLVQSGETTASPERDFTVKVDVKGLDPATYYFYRFQALGNYSVIGRTKTAPAGATRQVNLAVVSCSNYEAGYFNALKRIAQCNDIDAVLHLGDYIYEYGPGTYGDTSLGRIHLPPKEIVSLSDYRTRYAQYRLDQDFQQAHQFQPFITVWDDHEITNNAYIEGAQNHQADQEGAYQTRKSAAKQAYYEWLPIRETKDRLYRHFAYGDLVDLIMLDERLAGRTAPVDSLSDPNYLNDQRTMLGKEQKDWFFDKLRSSTATWKVIGNQVLFSDLQFDQIFPDRPRNLDAWDGYPYEKRSIIDFIQSGNFKNIIFVTGDTHCSWAFEVPASLEAYKKAPDQGGIAVEFGTTSVSSANYDEYTSTDTVLMTQKLYQNPVYNPHLKYVNLKEHGYLLLSLTKDQAIAKWYYVPTVKNPVNKEMLGKELIVKNGESKLVFN